MGKNRILARKSGFGARAWRRKSKLHTEGRRISRRKGRDDNQNYLPGARMKKHERVSGRKGFLGGPGNIGFALAKPETRKEGRKTNGPSMR